MSAIRPKETSGQTLARTIYFKYQLLVFGGNDGTKTPSQMLQAAKDSGKISEEVFKGIRKHLKVIRKAKLKEQKDHSATRIQNAVRVYLAENADKGGGGAAAAAAPASPEEKGTRVEGKDADTRAPSLKPVKKQAPKPAPKKTSKKKKKKSKKTKKAKGSRSTSTGGGGVGGAGGGGRAKAAAPNEENAADDPWAEIERLAAANGAAAAAAAGEQRPFLIACSPSFQAHVVTKASTQPGFGKSHQIFLHFIHHSNMPMFPELLRGLKKYHFELLTYYHVTQKKSPQRKLSRKKIDQILLREKLLDKTERTALYDYIQKELETWQGGSEGPSLSIKTLNDFIHATKPLLQIYLGEIGGPFDPIVAQDTDLDSKKEMLSWLQTYMDSLVAYKKRVQTSLKLFYKTPCPVKAREVWKSAAQLPVHTSFQILIDLLTKNPLHPGNFTAKMSIFEVDLQAGGMFDKLLERVVIPLYLESENPEAFATRWMHEVAHQQHPEVLPILQQPKAYHYLLLEARLRDAKIEILEKKIEETIKEAYASGVISPWTRALPLNALIANITHAVDVKLIAAEKDPAKIQTWFKNQLHLIKGEMLESSKATEVEKRIYCAGLTSQLDAKDGTECLISTSASNSYAAITGTVARHINRVTHDRVNLQRVGVQAICNYYTILMTLIDRMEEAGVS